MGTSCLYLLSAGTQVCTITLQEPIAVLKVDRCMGENKFRIQENIISWDELNFSEVNYRKYLKQIVLRNRTE